MTSVNQRKMKTQKLLLRKLRRNVSDVTNYSSVYCYSAADNEYISDNNYISSNDYISAFRYSSFFGVFWLTSAWLCGLKII